MHRSFALLVLAFVPFVACSHDDEERPVIETAGLHEPCQEGSCATGQECIDVAHPESPGQFCEIVCGDDVDCPEGLSCNVPPLIPDMVAYICE